jgi:hypothetical protein
LRRFFVGNLLATTREAAVRQGFPDRLPEARGLTMWCGSRRARRATALAPLASRRAHRTLLQGANMSTRDIDIGSKISPTRESAWK